MEVRHPTAEPRWRLGFSATQPKDATMNPPSDPYQAALERLPHGAGFRFVDRIVSLTPGEEGMGEYDLPADAPFLSGHFPGDPMMPGVLLLEAAAQFAGVVAQSHPHLAPLPDLRLAAVRNARIRGTVRPGQTVQLRARVTGRFERLVQASTEVRAAGTPILTADLVLGSAGPLPGPER